MTHIILTSGTEYNVTETVQQILELSGRGEAFNLTLSEGGEVTVFPNSIVSAQMV